MESAGIPSNSYDPKEDRAHHVSVLLGQGISACVVHALRTGQPQLLVHAPGTEALAHPALPTDPRSVSFVSLPTWSTLVPDGALQPDSHAQHLNLVHHRVPVGLVRDEPVRTLGATCLYVHDEDHERAVLGRFPHARALPLQAVLVQGAQQRSVLGSVVLIHRGADRVDICVAREQRILLSASYPAHHPEDLLYFSLLATEQCGLSPKDVPVRTGGTHLLQTERDLLQRYFADHASAARPEFHHLAASDTGPLDRWMAAIDQFACVS